ncbi:MAG: hypothetical protein ACJ71I_17725, partial [Nitrososphaeraceae archaeon]
MIAYNNTSYNNITAETIKEKEKDPFLKRILIIDDDPDITLTFKAGLEEYYDDDSNGNNKTRFEVYTYN